MSGLTIYQACVLAAIASSLRVRHVSPSVREIGRLLMIRSTNGVWCHLRTLERKGYISRQPCTRSIRVTRLGWAAVSRGHR